LRGIGCPGSRPHSGRLLRSGQRDSEAPDFLQIDWKESKAMKRFRVATLVALAIVAVASLSLAKQKKAKAGPLTGTWECTSHGGPQGDMQFTLYLEQANDSVSGSVSSPIGGTEITSGAFKKKHVEIHIDTPQGNYLLTGKLKKAALSGDWSTDTGLKGTWDGKKSSARSSQ
jgi:hypothetical protein